MKQNLTVLTVAVLMLINITGCSVVRFAETRIGDGVKKANKTVMDLDFQLGFNATDSSLSVTLEYQPYAIYKPRITLTDLGVGLTSLGLLGKVLYDNWDHDYTFTFVDDTFDWYGSEPWEKAVLIGVPVDILLYWAFAYTFDRRAVRLQKQPLTEHPYRIVLPDHGNIGRDYRTTTGIERIYIKDFPVWKSEIHHTSRALNPLSFGFLRRSVESGIVETIRFHLLYGIRLQRKLK